MNEIQSITAAVIKILERSKQKARHGSELAEVVSMLIDTDMSAGDIKDTLRVLARGDLADHYNKTPATHYARRWQWNVGK